MIINLIKELLITYWNQLLILIGIVGYFGNRFFERKAKDLELKSTLFQTQKLAAINTFIRAYTDAETMLNHLPYYEIFNGKYSSKDLDLMIQPSLTTLRKGFNELTLFVKDSELKTYQMINDNIIELNNLLSNLYFNRSSKENISKEANEYSYAVVEMMRVNKTLISLIGVEFRKAYHQL
jgi:hypothetical protein